MSILSVNTTSISQVVEKDIEKFNNLFNKALDEFNSEYRMSGFVDGGEIDIQLRVNYSGTYSVTGIHLTSIDGYENALRKLAIDEIELLSRNFKKYHDFDFSIDNIDSFILKVVYVVGFDYASLYPRITGMPIGGQMVGLCHISDVDFSKLMVKYGDSLKSKGGDLSKIEWGGSIKH